MRILLLISLLFAFGARAEETAQPAEKPAEEKAQPAKKPAEENTSNEKKASPADNVSFYANMGQANRPEAAYRGLPPATEAAKPPKQVSVGVNVKF